MSLTYQGCPLEQLPPLRDATDFRQQLFGAYVQRMFQRRNRTTPQYSNEQTTHWLIWMAQRMVQTSQTVFLIDRLQPSLLQTRAQRFRYRLESSLSAWLIVGLSYGLSYGLSAGLSAGLIGGLIGGLIVALLTAIQGNIQPVETLKWSWTETKKSILTGLIFGQIFGLLLGMIGGLFFGLMNGLLTGLLLGSAAGSIYGLIGGFKGPAMQKRSEPNQGIWKSARNSLTVGLIFGQIFGLLSGLSYGLSYGLTGGLSYGLIGVLIGGGLACLRHFCLRLMLSRLGYSPRNYARFLDYATERLFLQKVGGGYIFIHRMLLEHFAQMELSPKSPK